MAMSIRMQAQNLLTQLDAMKEAKDVSPVSSVILIELALREAESISLNMIAYLDETEERKLEVKFPQRKQGIRKLWSRFQRQDKANWEARKDV